MRNKKVGSDFLEKSRHGHDQAKTVLAGFWCRKLF